MSQCQKPRESFQLRYGIHFWASLIVSMNWHLSSLSCLLCKYQESWTCDVKNWVPFLVECTRIQEVDPIQSAQRKWVGNLHWSKNHASSRRANIKVLIKPKRFVCPIKFHLLLKAKLSVSTSESLVFCCCILCMNIKIFVLKCTILLYDWLMMSVSWKDHCLVEYHIKLASLNFPWCLRWLNYFLLCMCWFEKLILLCIF